MALVSLPWRGGHGRAQPPWPAMGARPERGEGEGEWERAGGTAGGVTGGGEDGAMGGCSRGEGSRPMAAWFGPAAALRAMCMRKKTWGKKRKRRERKRKERKREKEKERKNGKIVNVGILGEKNKR
jgi:hypothetical protein